MIENSENEESFHDINLKNNILNKEKIDNSEREKSFFINWQEDLNEEDLSYYNHK